MFYESRNPHVKFLSTLILLRTLSPTQTDVLARVRLWENAPMCPIITTLFNSHFSTYMYLKQNYIPLIASALSDFRFVKSGVEGRECKGVFRRVSRYLGGHAVRPSFAQTRTPRFRRRRSRHHDARFTLIARCDTIFALLTNTSPFARPVTRLLVLFFRSLARVRVWFDFVFTLRWCDWNWMELSLHVHPFPIKSFILVTLPSCPNISFVVSNCLGCKNITHLMLKVPSFFSAFLQSCSNESFFRQISALLRTANLSAFVLEKVVTLLSKLSKVGDSL